MKFIRLIRVQFVQCCKDPKLVVMSFLFPLVLSLFIFMGMGDSDFDPAVGFINKDSGSYAQEMIEKLEIDYLILEDEDTAQEMIRQKELGVCYVLEETFTDTLQNIEVPQIHCYKQESDAADMTVYYEQQMVSYISDLLKSSMYEAYGIDKDEFLSTSLIQTSLTYPENFSIETDSAVAMLVIYFMFMASDSIARDLFKLKDSRVLRRLMSTENSDFSIISSFILSRFLFQVVIAAAAFLVINMLIEFGSVHLGLLLAVIVLMSLISISLSVVLVRVVRKEGVLTLTASILSIVLFFGGFFGLMGNMFGVPKMLITVSRFSPFYWAYDIVFYNNLMPNFIILILTAGVLMTAGSFKLQSFINE